MLYPEEFFDVTVCPFKDLFLLDKPVWETLKHLDSYINKQSLGKISIKIPECVYLINPELISIVKETKIYPGACLEGPCILGDHVEIGPGAYIRPYSLIGNGVKIGHSSEVKHSIILNEAKAPHFNYIGDSILGQGVNLGAGVICANFKINKTEVVIKIGKEKYATGLKKLGAIIGDQSFLGCNSVISPGTVLKKEFLCLPCTHVCGACLS